MSYIYLSKVYQLRIYSTPAGRACLIRSTPTWLHKISGKIHQIIVLLFHPRTSSSSPEAKYEVPTTWSMTFQRLQFWLQGEMRLNVLGENGTRLPIYDLVCNCRRGAPSYKRRAQPDRKEILRHIPLSAWLEARVTWPEIHYSPQDMGEVLFNPHGQETWAARVSRGGW